MVILKSSPSVKSSILTHENQIHAYIGIIGQIQRLVADPLEKYYMHFVCEQ